MAKTDSIDHLYRYFGRVLVLFISVLYLAACTTTTPPSQTGGVSTQPPIDQGTNVPDVVQTIPDVPDTTDVVTTPDTSSTTTVEVSPPSYNNRSGLTPPHMRGRDIKRLALLLPFSAESPRLRQEAASMLKAAQLAVFERPEADILLIALDTGGTASGASTATRAAVGSGADVILGPVLSSAVSGASRLAQRDNVPVIAFSTDQSVAGNGTYLLSFPPEAEVARIVQYAASTGTQNYAFLGPRDTYGKRVLNEYEASVRAVGGQITAKEVYSGNDISAMQEPARRMANAYKANEKAVGRTGRRLFEAVMLPESGVELRSLAPLLPYYDIDPDDVQFMGTSLWHKKDVVREPALSGGIFAGPDETAQQRFLSQYDSQYAEEPSQLASLAFDAVNIGVVVADGNPRSRRQRAEDPTGFYGADGLISWDSSGRPDRGLAVYQIQGGRFVVIDPAPTRTSGPS